ncbi:hypothetical protein [Undibacterium sp. TJN19]|uniref:hypothetical protein n=1 Tax=Undibacterium sp. TJN19 TaxID=3413055 RepID=UPI003BF2D8FD
MMIFPFCLIDPEWYYIRKFIRHLKENHYPKEDEHGWYYISRVFKGEHILYTDPNGSSFVDVETREFTEIFAKSIKRWDFFWPVSDKQRKIVLERMQRYVEEDCRVCKIVDE